MVVGGPKSGRSTILRDLVLSLALTHTPREVQIYGLDFGGGALASLRDLPHVGGVAARLDARRGPPDRRRAGRAAGRAGAPVRRRRHRLDGLLPAGRRAGQHADDPFGDVFLVVDGWATIRSDFEDLEGTINDLANRGLTYGIHVIGSATRWNDIRPAVRDLFGSRLELRLGDPSDSAVDRRAAMNVPPERRRVAASSRVACSSSRRCPRMDGQPRRGPGRRRWTGWSARSGPAWPDAGAPPVRLLPATLPYASLPIADRQRSGHPDRHRRGRPAPGLGGLRGRLAPAALRRLRVRQDARSCGPSAQSIVDRYELTEARIIMVDYRRSLLGAINSPHLIGTGTSAQTSADDHHRGRSRYCATGCPAPT